MKDAPQPPVETLSEERVTLPSAPPPTQPQALRGPPSPGSVLAGRYTVLDTLGQGGMGVVLAAYDSRLDRRVALKLLHPAENLPTGHGSSGGSHDYRTRLVREAQAMARLSHPHVVTVYDAGPLEGDTVFIAMEFVQGTTLRAWCKEKPRPWREVLDAFLDAGSGLAAAHAAGLVHRDFKPDNVLVGQDGRVRVTDFGVARAESQPTPTPRAAPPPSLDGSPGAEWETCLTVPGTVVGTPRYIAPEVYRGEPADARSDVFSFCVALYESLYGLQPFAGDSRQERLWAQLRGQVRPPPATSPVPAWVARAVLQGLRPSPDERPVSLHALLAVLRDDPEVRRRARRRVLAMGATVGSLAALCLTLGGLHLQARRGVCADQTRRLEDVWDEATRARVRANLLATGLPYAQDTARRLKEVLDTYAGAWMKQRAQACEAAREQAGQPRSLATLQVYCLERRHGQLRALTGVLAAAPDRELLPTAIEAALSLPPLEYCADARALTAAVPPPEDPRVRASVEQLQPEVDRLEALYKAGKYKEGLALGARLEEPLATLDYLPLRARAGYLLSRLKEASGDYLGAEATLREVISLASRGGDRLLAARAWSSLALLLGGPQSRPQEALGLELVVQSVAELADDPQARAIALYTLGSLLQRLGRFEEALERLERAVALLQQALGPEHPDVLAAVNGLGTSYLRLARFEDALAQRERVLAARQKALGHEHPEVAASHHRMGQVLSHLGRYEASRASFERALALQNKALGPEHPEVAGTLNSLGSLLIDMGRLDEGRSKLEQALALRQKALGPAHTSVATSMSNLGEVALLLGRLEEARGYLERALALQWKTPGPRHPNTLSTLTKLGTVLGELGQHEAARARLEQALALWHKGLGAEHPGVVSTLSSLGELSWRQGRFGEAQGHYARALALAEKALGPRSQRLIEPLLGQGELALAQGRPAEALPPLERAVGLSDKPDARLRFALARALWDSGGERARAVELASQARDDYQRLGHPRLAEVSRWLAAHPRP